jgi:hypothetical protein
LLFLMEHIAKFEPATGEFATYLEIPSASNS